MWNQGIFILNSLIDICLIVAIWKVNKKKPKEKTIVVNRVSPMKELIESGNEVIWMREYEGKRAFGGEDVVFPKWMPVSSGEAGHIRKHAVLLSYLEHDRSKLKRYTICDPGTSTCFAVLFICYNKFTQQIFILDEIYEKDRKRTDSGQMWERIRKKESDP